MDALGSTEPVKRPYGIHWHCVLHTDHQGGRQSSSCVSVSIGLSKKREVRRGFCLLSLPGAAGESQDFLSY